MPTFVGGSIAAFAMNGSLYAVLLYLVIYLQDILGYSAQDAGLRLAIISGAQFATATIAGRVSERVPARWLIGPGLLLVGVGLVVMGGLTAGSTWTHLLLIRSADFVRTGREGPARAAATDQRAGEPGGYSRFVRP